MDELREILGSTSFGSRTAESELKQLGRYFVETAQWNRIRAGEKDIVYGPKGAGKSAIYGVLVQRSDELIGDGVLVRSAENAQGAPIFKELMSEPPQSEEEWRVLWRAYFIGIVAEVLDEYVIEVAAAKRVREGLEAHGLRRGKGIKASLQAAREFAKRMRMAKSVEATAAADAAGVKVVGKVELGDDQRNAIAAAAEVADLLEAANTALDEADLSVWIALDRLDAAFEDSQIEGPAIRALMRVYLDLTTFDRITPKIFLRNDIWEEITAVKSFREGSHIIRDETISWNRDTLLNLSVRRVLENQVLRERFGVQSEEVLTSLDAQEELFEELFEAGSGESMLDWAIESISDGRGQSAPRELIDLLGELREKQLERLQVGRAGPPGNAIFEADVRALALREVSITHLVQTLYFETPKVKDFVEMLRGGPVTYTDDDLDQLWGGSVDSVEGLVKTLVKAGFLKRQPPGEGGFEVAMLYRPGLELSASGEFKN